ncbi:MAG: hypothetical protein HQ568_11685 [Calditrichaeota bacterium]|nr:hypothetical protein [Calditrichota bacterium]
MRKRKNVILYSVLLITILAFNLNANAEEFRDLARNEYFSRLFIAPTGRMLPSGIVGISFGGAFATQGGKEYLGLFSIGLGGVAELEVSTSHLVTNIFYSSKWIGTTALKFTIYNGKPETKLPRVMLAFRSNRWSSIEGSGNELSGPANPDGNSGISSVDFKTHLTSLYLSATSELTPKFSVSGGLVWHDIRTKDLSYFSNRQINLPGDMKKSVVGVFGGVENLLNPNTYSILEFGLIPEIRFDNKMEQMMIGQLWYSMVGVRFFFRETAAVDAGIKYRSDYSGLADAEIVVGLNIGIDVAEEIGVKGK